MTSTHKTLSVFRMKQMTAAILAATALAACGGGGSGNTVAAKQGVALYTTAPSNVSVAAGMSSTFDIGGGGASGLQFVNYQASSSNTQVASVKLSGSTLTVSGLNSGDATITVSDGNGATVKFTVNVPSVTGTKLMVAAPAAISLVPGNSAQYGVSGGSGQYTVVSSNPNVIVPSTSGGKVSVTAANPGTATVIVFDSAGNQAKFDLTVTSLQPTGDTALYTTAPPSVTLPANTSASYKIAGGQAPYLATSSNIALIRAAVDGSTLTLTSTAASGTADVVVRDAKGAVVQISTIETGTPAAKFFTTAPATLAVTVGTNPAFKIQGGVPPYTVSSSAPSVVNATITNDTLNVTGTAPGTASVVVFDSTGATLTSSVTVQAGADPSPLFTTSPDAITVAAGAAPTYTITGGVGPYTVASSNPAVATVTQSGNTFTTSGNSAGDATIVIKDANGVSTSVKVTVTTPTTTAPGPLFTTAPDSIAVAINASPTYTIAGGTGPYVVSSSDPTIAKVTQNGNVFTVTGVSGGTTLLYVKDSKGTTQGISVTVKAGAAPGALFSTAPDAVTVAANGSATFGISGGRAPYVVNSSNAAVAKVTQDGNNFTITGVGGGDTTVTIKDSTGASVTVRTTVQAGASPGALFTTAPDSITVAKGASPTFTISGGSAPYVVTSSNTAVMTVTQNGNTFTATGVDGGSATVTIKDANGSSVAVKVTVQTAAAATPGPLFTTAPDSIVVAVGAKPTYTISGGSAPYVVTSSDVTVATINQTGNTFIVTGVGAGTGTIAVKDVTGASTTIQIKVQ